MYFYCKVCGYAIFGKPKNIKCPECKNKLKQNTDKWMCTIMTVEQIEKDEIKKIYIRNNYSDEAIAVIKLIELFNEYGVNIKGEILDYLEKY